MTGQIVSYILYAGALLLLIYVMRQIYSKGLTEALTVGVAIELLGIVVAVLIAINISEPQEVKDISGAWNGFGTVNTPDGIFDTTMSLTIFNDCQTGKICGQGFSLRSLVHFH